MRLVRFALAAVVASTLFACSQSKDVRTMNVNMMGSKFQPAELTVKAGETVLFRLDNRDSVDHEMVIGDEDEQAAHAKASGDHHGMQGAATVSARKRGQLRYTFPKEPTELILGCHIDDHYEQGMRGTVRVVAG